MRSKKPDKKESLMIGIEESYDTVGYQISGNPQSRVFAKANQDGSFGLFKYVYNSSQDWLVFNSGFPTDVKRIGEARNEREARNKLKMHLRSSEKMIEDKVETTSGLD
jgi:hypothetical protein